MNETTEFRPVVLARRLAREARAAALSTLRRRDGAPFGSFAGVSTDLDGSPIVLISELAAHTRNLAGDPRAAFLFVAALGDDPQTAPRLTLTGRIEALADDRVARRRHLARHPAAARQADFGDFGFRRLVVEDGHLVAGFGRAARVAAADYLLDTAVCAHFADAEQDLVAEANRAPTRIAELARRAGLVGDGWSAIGADPEGLDLVRPSETGRILGRIGLGEAVDRPDRLIAALDDWRPTDGTQEIH